MRGVWVSVLILIGIGLGLLACQLEDATPGPGAYPGTWSEAAARDCRASGGDPIMTGFGRQACVRPTTDAGKSCSNSKQCESLCMAQTRTCGPQTPMFGCHQVFEDGAEVGICID
jgi:hypothetical protein